MGSLKQADRLMQFASPLGKDVLLIESIQGEEGISRLFEYTVDLLATVDTTIDPKSLVGAKALVALSLNDVEGSRYVNGIIASFEQCAGDQEFNVYKARIVPGMWQLTLCANCRIFQQKTVLEIAKSVIGEYGLTLSDQTTGSYQPLEYCTQYSESDFHFVSRILEESGIFYWFEQTDQDNKIVLGDDRTAYQDCPISASVPFALSKRGAEGAYGAMVTEFTLTATMVSGKHTTADYTYLNFQRADAPDENSASTYGNNGFEQYHYPAGVEGYANDATQETTDLETLFIKSRQLANDALAEVLRGTSNARSLCAGYTFTMQSHPRSDWNRKYLLNTLSFSADQVPPYRANDLGKDTEYVNHFTAFSSDITYKPPSTYQKPRIYGPQTARVVGPSGEEIYLDELGRAKVQFFWDKVDSVGSTTNTTWVRVAQAWAGNGWGAFFWPRVNDEVVIQFLNGDPDNPVITGSVYNAKNTVPYTLPDNGTQSGIVTRSSKGGSGTNSNVLRFEDKMGSEQIYIHAEKDMDLSVEHDRRTLVANNDSLTVQGNQMEAITGDYGDKIQGNSKVQIMQNSDLNVGSNLTEKVGSNHQMDIGSNQDIHVSSAHSLVADQTIYIKGGQSVVIEAGMSLSLKVGGNFVTIGPAGVAIMGTMVQINSGGSAGSGSAGSIQSPQPPTAPDDAFKGDASGGGQGGGGGSSSSPTISAPTAGPAGTANLAAMLSGPSATPPPSPDAGAGSDSGANPVNQAEQAVQQTANQAEQAVQQTANQAVQAVQQTVNQAEQAVQQALNQAAQMANQAAQAAQQAANQAQQAAQQAEQNAQQAVDQVKQQAGQTYQQAKQAVQQAQQAYNEASAAGKKAAQQALDQAEAQAKQAGAAAVAAVQAAQKQAQEVEQQAQMAAQQAAQQAANAARAAAQQAQQAVQQTEQQAKQAAQQAEQAAQQAAKQAQQAASQAQQVAQQAAAQVKQAAAGAQQQAQQASQAAQQSAAQAANQAKSWF
jgi:type VI secretion system secreted protein VgrG